MDLDGGLEYGHEENLTKSIATSITRDYLDFLKYDNLELSQTCAIPEKCARARVQAQLFQPFDWDFRPY